MLHIIKSGRSYEGMMTAEFSVLLDNRMLTRSSELIQVLSCAVAAVYVFNIDFPKNLKFFLSVCPMLFSEASTPGQQDREKAGGEAQSNRVMFCKVGPN